MISPIVTQFQLFERHHFLLSLSAILIAFRVVGHYHTIELAESMRPFCYDSACRSCEQRGAVLQNHSPQRAVHFTKGVWTRMLELIIYLPYFDHYVLFWCLVFCSVSSSTDVHN